MELLCIYIIQDPTSALLQYSFTFAATMPPALSQATINNIIHLCNQKLSISIIHWTVEDWKRVVWSDETKINRVGSDGRNWVWKKQGGEAQ